MNEFQRILRDNRLQPEKEPINLRNKTADIDFPIVGLRTSLYTFYTVSGKRCHFIFCHNFAKS